jgi:hypothetical protein
MQFKAAGSFSGIRQMLPCGNCIGCRLERSRIWAVRCMHEARMFRENAFLTLTYRTECLPPVGTLVLADLQKFLKRLRHHMGAFRYYACGEYGDQSFRPHYHVLLFGLDFADKRKYNDKLFTSKTLDEIWSFGECKIGEVTFDSAAYVARYCMKKVSGKQREAGHYLVYDGDGVISERLPEFATMSRRPGLGTAYYEKFGGEVRTHDTLIVNGVETSSIRFYDLKFEALDPVGFARVKKARSAATLKEWRLFCIERSRGRMRVKEVIQVRRFKQLARSI